VCGCFLKILIYYNNITSARRVRRACGMPACERALIYIGEAAFTFDYSSRTYLPIYYTRKQVQLSSLPRPPSLAIYRGVIHAATSGSTYIIIYHFRFFFLVFTVNRHRRLRHTITDGYCKHIVWNNISETYFRY